MNCRVFLLGAFALPGMAFGQFYAFSSGQVAGTYHVTGISDDGKSVVGYNEGAALKGWRYTIGGSFQWLEAINAGSSSYSRAMAVSGDGKVVAGEGSSFRSQTKWDLAGTPSNYDNYFTSSVIMGLSFDGTIAAAQVGPGAYRVVNGVYTALPTGGLPYNPLFITGMSGDGTKIVATNMLIGGIGPTKYAIWRQGIGTTLINGANGDLHISRDGSTIVSASNVFDSTFTPFALSLLPNTNSLNADAVSDSGAFIGGYTVDDSTGIRYATIWDQNRTPMRLSTFLASRGINASAYDMEGVTAIEESSDGLTFSGTYREGNNHRAFAVHVVPEPASLSVLALGLCVIVRQKKSRVQ